MRCLVLAALLALSATAASAQSFDQRGYDPRTDRYDNRFNRDDRYDDRYRNPRYEQGARAYDRYEDRRYDERRYDERYDDRDRRDDRRQQDQGNNIVIPLDKIFGK